MARFIGGERSQNDAAVAKHFINAKEQIGFLITEITLILTLIPLSCCTGCVKHGRNYHWGYP